MKKVITLVIVITMVFSMGAWTNGAWNSKIEEHLRSFGFIRSEDDDNIWVCDIVDCSAADFDYVIIHGVYWMEENILIMTAVGVDTYRNLVTTIYTGAGQWDHEIEDFEENAYVEWEHSDYSY